MNRRSFFARMLGVACIAVAERVMPAVLIAPAVVKRREEGKVSAYLVAWNALPCSIELGSFPDPGDEQKYRGRDHDCLEFDEAVSAYLVAWNALPEPLRTQMLKGDFS